MMRRILFALVMTATCSSVALASGDPAAGKEKAQQVCAACHGADGNSTPDFPKLAGQHPDYLASALLQYKSGKRKNAIMAGFAATLSDKDMVDLAAYFSSQQGLAIKY